MSEFMPFEVALEIVYHLARARWRESKEIETGRTPEDIGRIETQRIALETTHDFIVNNPDGEFEDHLAAVQIDIEEGVASMIFDQEYVQTDEETSANLGRAIFRYIVLGLDPQGLVGLKKVLK